MLSHYTVIVYLSALTMVGMIIGANENKFMLREKKLWFQLLFLMLAIVNIAEWGAAFLDGNIAMIPLRIAAKFTELTLTPFTIFIGNMVIGSKKYIKPSLIICGSNVLLQVISLFTGVVFSIDSNSVYHRNELYYAYVALMVIVIIIWIFGAFDYIKKFQAKNIPLLIVIIILETIAITSQLIFSYLRLDWTCASFAALLAYMYVDQLQQQTDPVTQLLNRRAYEIHAQNIRQNNVLIFFDVDGFKSVNDTYGHTVGDECLKAVANEIKKTFNKAGACYRYGGDEFCVIVTKNQEKIMEYLSQLVKNIAETRYYDNLPLPRVSFGYATLTENMTYTEAVEKADEMMYCYKKKAR